MISQSLWQLFFCIDTIVFNGSTYLHNLFYKKTYDISGAKLLYVIKINQVISFKSDITHHALLGSRLGYFIISAIMKLIM